MLQSVASSTISESGSRVSIYLSSLASGLVALGFSSSSPRAFASLADFVSLSAGALAPAGIWLAMKGKYPTDEVAALPAKAEMFHVEQLEVPGLAAQRCLLWLRPRDAG